METLSNCAYCHKISNRLHNLRTDGIRSKQVGVGSSGERIATSYVKAEQRTVTQLCDTNLYFKLSKTRRIPPECSTGFSIQNIFEISRGETCRRAYGKILHLETLAKVRKSKDGRQKVHYLAIRTGWGGRLRCI